MGTSRMESCRNIWHSHRKLQGKVPYHKCHYNRSVLGPLTEQPGHLLEHRGAHFNHHLSRIPIESLGCLKRSLNDDGKAKDPYHFVPITLPPRAFSVCSNVNA